MKKILVTAGPVHAYLDPVKILTNRFKGRMMLEIAENLRLVHGDVNEVTTICSKDTLPNNVNWIGGEVVYHDGFMDYMAKVNSMAKDFDAVILGAAVANLIPQKPWTDKFPSHLYKPGEVINIPFVIAPRVIDQVKANMKPGAHLFGFKLLKGQSFDELIKAAYGVLRESGATVVFANDPTIGLDKKFAVTKERAVVPVSLDEMPKFIVSIMDDVYYHSKVKMETEGGYSEAWADVEKRLDYHRNSFVEVEDGMVFGTVAFRFQKKDGGFGFVTTARGKRETDDLVVVTGVDHEKKLVSVFPRVNDKKATLNAPLLARIFEKNPEVKGILHFHRQEPGLTTQKWAPPGTVRDTERDVSKPFNIEGHGCYLFVDEKGQVVLNVAGTLALPVDGSMLTVMVGCLAESSSVRWRWKTS